MNEKENESKLRGLCVVRVNKGVLLAKLKENLARHREVFLKALDAYKKKVVEELDRRLDDARKGWRYDIAIGLAQPQDHTKDYDRVISLLEMSLNDELELTQQDFAIYVIDDWGWKQQFTPTNAAYGVAS